MEKGLVININDKKYSGNIFRYCPLNTTIDEKNKWIDKIKNLISISS